MGLESACKMRWAGNWPQIADENQDITNRNVPNDAQLHQQLQEQRVKYYLNIFEGWIGVLNNIVCIQILCFIIYSAATITATIDENGSSNDSATISSAHFTTNAAYMGSDC